LIPEPPHHLRQPFGHDTPNWYYTVHRSALFETRNDSAKFLVQYLQAHFGAPMFDAFDAKREQVWVCSVHTFHLNKANPSRAPSVNTFERSFTVDLVA
jgi:hypothetical protein